MTHNLINLDDAKLIGRVKRSLRRHVRTGQRPNWFKVELVGRAGGDVTTDQGETYTIGFIANGTRIQWQKQIHTN